MYKFRWHIGAAVASCAIATWLLWALLATGTNACDHDWTYFHSMAAITRETLLGYGQIPVWNAFTCGGTDHLGNPQTAFLSPLIGIVLIFGITLGLKLFAWAHMVVGLMGGWWLGRAAGLRSAWPLATACLTGAMGFHLWHLRAGHITFLQLLWLPWILWAYIASEERPRLCMAGAAFLAVALLSGGTYVGAFAAILLGSHALFASVTLIPGAWRRLSKTAPTGGEGQNSAASNLRALLRTPAGRAGGILLGGTLLAAVKVIPSLLFLSRFERTVFPSESVGLNALWQMFFDPAVRGGGAHFHHRIHEYGNYIGVAAPIFFTLAIFAWRKSTPWLLAGIFCLCMTAGGLSPWAPYSLLRHLPVFSSLRVPSRYTLDAILAFAIAGSYGLAHVLRASRGWPQRARLGSGLVLGALCLAMATSLLWHNGGIVTEKVCRAKVAEAKPLQEFHQVKGNRWRMWATVRRGVGTVPCNEAAKVPRSSELWTGPGPQADVLPSTAGSIANIEFSPHYWSMHVALTEPAVVRLNQNFRPGFRPSVGELVDAQGLVGIQLDPGDYELVVRMIPTEAIAGLFISLIAWGALLAGWLLPRYRDQRNAKGQPA